MLLTAVWVNWNMASHSHWELVLVLISQQASRQLALLVNQWKHTRGSHGQRFDISNRPPNMKRPFKNKMWWLVKRFPRWELTSCHRLYRTLSPELESVGVVTPSLDWEMSIENWPWIEWELFKVSRLSHPAWIEKCQLRIDPGLSENFSRFQGCHTRPGLSGNFN